MDNPPPRSFCRRCQVSAKFSAAALAFFLPFTTECVVAHPEIEDQIQDLTKLIESVPEGSRAEIFLQRGELFRVHEEWEEALSDFDRVKVLDPSLADVRLSMGRLFQEKGEPGRAVTELEEFLKANPGDAMALMVRARAYRDLEEFPEADKDYAAAIRCSESPTPELYLERVRSLKESGRADAVSMCLAVLDGGLDRLGPLASLQLPAIELERFRGDADGALERIDLLEGTGANAVKKFGLRGDVLVEAGRVDRARAAYTEALQEFSRLSPRQKSLRPIQQMKAKIESTLSMLSGKTAVEVGEEQTE